MMRVRGRSGRYPSRLGGGWALLVCGLLLGPAGCRDDAGQEAGPPAENPQQAEPLRVGSYALGERALYGARSDGGLEVLAVLPSEGSAPDTLEECAQAIPKLRPVRFRELTLAPDPRWAAWSTSGPVSCVGAVGPGKPRVRVLGRWSAARPDSLMWAPASRYLAVWLKHLDGRRSLAVVDAERGERLELPWEAECETSGECDVVEVEWLGGSLLDVRIRLGPAESSVPFEVNVGTGLPLPREETS